MASFFLITPVQKLKILIEIANYICFHRILSKIQNSIFRIHFGLKNCDFQQFELRARFDLLFESIDEHRDSIAIGSYVLNMLFGLSHES